jgi:type IV pilus assembly protein PilQ
MRVSTGLFRPAWFAAVVLLCAWGSAPAAGDGDNSVEKVDAIQTGAGVFVTIQLKDAVTAIPNSFSVTNPARIAIDLPSTASGMGRNAIDVNQGDLRSVNLVQAQGRTRIVLNLRKPLTYAVSVSGRNVQVSLGTGAEAPTFPAIVGADAAPVAAPAATAAAAPAAAPAAESAATPVAAPAAVSAAVSAAVPAPVASAAPAPATAPLASAAAPAVRAPPGARAVNALDFRRGADGEGRVIIDLSDANTGVDVRQQGNAIVVEFLATGIPESLRHRLDVTDFGTPVARVTASQQGANARVLIEPRGKWEHNAYQSDRRFVVEVKPVVEDPTRLFQGSRKGYQGERLSLNFQNVDVRSLLQVIADFTNLNIITSDSVQGSITLRLKDVPWDQALDLILQSKGLDMRKNGNVILVAPRDELATKEKLDLEARSQLSELEPLRTETFVINYQKAEDVRKLLVDSQQRMLSKRGSASVDVRTNQLFVRDTGDSLEDVRRLIRRIDVAVPQVMIEARIVEADQNFSRDLGVRLGGSSGFPRAIGHSGVYGTLGGGGGSNNNGTLLNSGPTSVSIGTTPSNIGTNALVTTSSTVSSAPFVNLPGGGLNGFSPGAVSLSLFSADLSKFLSLEIDALELDGRGKVISSPRVTTADKVKAEIEQGTEIPYQSASAGGGIGTVQFRKAVLKLEVTPQITPEGAIFLNVKVNKDTPSSTVSTSAGVAIDTKNVSTQVLVENGGTVVLGGIFEETTNETVTKIPLLGDVPYLGFLFRNTATVRNRSELMIFITPRVVSSQIVAH